MKEQKATIDQLYKIFFRKKKNSYQSIIDRGHKKHCQESAKLNLKRPSEEKMDI